MGRTQDLLSIIRSKPDHLVVRALDELLPRWIPVEERLPEEGVDVLVMTKYGMHVASLDEDGLWNASHGDSWEFPNPTYWMPLPEPPGE